MILRTIGSGSIRARLGRVPYLAPALVCVVLAGLPVAAAAQENLLENPGLDTELLPWNLSPSTDFDPADGVPPGSASWRATIDGDSEIEDLLILSQCVDGIVAGTTYEFAGTFALHELPSGGSANIVIDWQSNPGCSGLMGTVAGTPVTTESSSWVSSTGSAVAPPGAQSAEFNVISGIAAFGPGSIGEPDFSLVEGDYLVGADDFFFGARQQVPTMSALWMAVLAVALLLLVAVRTFRPIGRVSG